MASKRKAMDGPINPSVKRVKIDGPVPVAVPTDTAQEATAQAQPSKKTERRKINKLVPVRPFPTVPSSVSATGPRSAHSEGKNYICITRRTPLAAYLRRCKDAIMEDGYKSLHLSAMGAAIPHALTLVASVPAVLPFASDEIRTEILTGTVEVTDEIIPDDEEEDVSYKTRGKSTVSIIVKIGDGIDDERATKRSTKRPKQEPTNRVREPNVGA